jgi:hypothetical protein
MSNAWNQAEDLTKKHAEQGGIFVRLANHGDKVVGAFCGEPYAREVHWTGERYEECTGEGCTHCGTGKKPSLRVMLNFFVPAESAMKIYEGGTRWFKDLLKIRGKYGLDSWLFEVERHGEAGSTKTTYSILPEVKVDGDLRAKIDAIEPHDLASLASGDEGSTASAGSAGTASIPVETVAPLVGRLKALPRSDVDTFLGRFGISRVRDLAANDEQAAFALLSELEAKHAPTPAAPADIDPFA